MMVSVWSGCGEEIKIHTEKFSNGKVEVEYQYYNHPENNKRIKNGWYNSYYVSGNYKEVGKYKENKKDGEWIEYDKDGRLKSIKTGPGENFNEETYETKTETEEITDEPTEEIIDELTEDEKPKKGFWKKEYKKPKRDPWRGQRG